MGQVVTEQVGWADDCSSRFSRAGTPSPSPSTRLADPVASLHMRSSRTLHRPHPTLTTAALSTPAPGRGTGGATGRAGPLPFEGRPARHGHPGRAPASHGSRTRTETSHPSGGLRVQASRTSGSPWASATRASGRLRTQTTRRLRRCAQVQPAGPHLRRVRCRARRPPHPGSGASGRAERPSHTPSSTSPPLTTKGACLFGGILVHHTRGRTSARPSSLALPRLPGAMALRRGEGTSPGRVHRLPVPLEDLPVGADVRRARRLHGPGRVRAAEPVRTLHLLGARPTTHPMTASLAATHRTRGRGKLDLTVRR